MELSLLFNLTNWIFRFVNHKKNFLIFQKGFFLPLLLWVLISFMNMFLYLSLFCHPFSTQGGNHKINWFFYYTLKCPLKSFFIFQKRNFWWFNECYFLILPKIFLLLRNFSPSHFKGQWWCITLKIAPGLRINSIRKI